MTRFFNFGLWLSVGALVLASGAPLFAGPAQDYDQAGMALYRAGQYTKSIQYFNNAVKADPSDAKAYEDMGSAYMKLDDKSNALASYQQALNLNPNDSTLQTLVDSLGGQTTDAASPSDQTSGDETQASQPAPQANPVFQGQPQLPVALKPAYNDNWASLNHSRYWSSFSMGYAYSSMTDMIKGAQKTNQAIANNGYTGSADFDHNGLDLNLELGFMLNPYNGLSLGIGYRRNFDFNQSIDFNNGGDFQITNLQPVVVPITLNYYLFLPDKGGRFFISAGAGLYYGDVRVDNNYDYSIANGSADYDEYTGDLTSTALGFQASIGRDFAVTDRVSISLFAKGYYAKLSNFQGTLIDVNGYSGRFGLAKDSLGVDVPPVTSIGGPGGDHYATVDFTGFDVGMSVNFYSF